MAAIKTVNFKNGQGTLSRTGWISTEKRENALNFLKAFTYLKGKWLVYFGYSARLLRYCNASCFNSNQQVMIVLRMNMKVKLLHIQAPRMSVFVEEIRCGGWRGARRIVVQVIVSWSRGRRNWGGLGGCGEGREVGFTLQQMVQKFDCFPFRTQMRRQDASVNVNWPLREIKRSGS